MTEDAKRTVETLRYCEESGARCGECPSGFNDKGVPNCHSMNAIADLIESLSAELEITEAVAAQARGLECERDLLAAELEQVKRERDAAVETMAENPRCETCKHYTPGYFCLGCKRGDKWQWRGVKEEKDE